MPQPPNIYPKGLIYDLDGVVMDSSTSLHYRAWEYLFVEKLHIPDFSVEDYQQHVSGKQRDKGFEDFVTLRALELGDTALLALASDPEQVAYHTDIKQERVQELLDDPSVEIPVYEDTLRLVREAKALGIKTAIASSSENTPKLLKKTGCEDLFDETAFGKLAIVRRVRRVLASKPAPDVFLAAADMLEVEPHEAIGFEDAGDGVRAINAAGMMSVAVEREPNEDLRNAGADLLLPNFDHLTIDGLARVFTKLRAA